MKISQKFPKKIINFLPTILVYSPQDLLYFLSQKLNFINPFDWAEIKVILDIKIPKITFKQNDKDIYQNGCFELAETFDVNIISNNLVLRFLG